VTFLVIGGVLFIAAGRLDWSEAWAFLIAYFVIALVTAVWMLRTNPELTQERARPGRNAKSWDNVLVVLNLVLTLALFAVIGLDAGRCGWSKVPLALRGLGLLGFIPAFGLPLWAAAVNAYLSSRVRIQTERGHAVVAAGPYRYVRHPMYAGMICYDLSVPLLLGSWWGLAVGAVMIAVPEYAAPGKSVKRRVASCQRTTSPAVAACRLYASCGFILGGFDACLYRGVMPGVHEIALFWHLLCTGTTWPQTLLWGMHEIALFWHLLFSASLEATP